MAICLRAVKWLQSAVSAPSVSRVLTPTVAPRIAGQARQLSGPSSDVSSSSVRGGVTAVEKADVLAKYWETHARRMTAGIVRDTNVWLFSRRPAAYTLEPGRALPNGVYVSDVLGDRAIPPPPPPPAKHADSIIKKRRKKMRKHKYEKMRKRQRFARLKLGQ
eukprot:TRINITY_DN5720_c0_g1_i1.p1 TRINITY_DN5720_c0_g1~~TRINITY_DN5720_c0_g1_i1.p1  ORF type:complete len:162 (+),score=45.29 TRINITY_DN5720_c0_g1_i1:889-1374(+)